MNNNRKILLSKLPEEGLRFFHGLSNWVEESKSIKSQLISWKEGEKQLTQLKCIKFKKGEVFATLREMEVNTLYIPEYRGGKFVLQHIRHAFCHNDLEYDMDLNQYRIKLTNNVKIAGQFSLEGIKEFASIFLSATTN